MEQHKFRILKSAALGQTSLEAAAEALHVDQRTVSQLVTIWSPHLDTLITHVDKLLKPTGTKAGQSAIKLNLAKALGITYRQVNRLLQSSGIVIPKPRSSEIRMNLQESARKRKEFQRNAAFSVISDVNTVENAAKTARVSPRQMYRLCNKLTKLVGTPFRDFAALPPKAKHVALGKISEIMKA